MNRIKTNSEMVLTCYGKIWAKDSKINDANKFISKRLDKKLLDVIKNEIGTVDVWIVVEEFRTNFLIGLTRFWIQRANSKWLRKKRIEKKKICKIQGSESIVFK